ncbi:L-serine ammonia-lyase, iron-sulfur-dependent, subunit alpha [Blautia glucerasea]|uniref:L-cysteine desulfidase family protein n=1 Tax=Blautia glucerasea TaxID=536633 RepID=UPI001D0755F8|nr:L-serine ammonia-lyase, iron-sulfur-dependent, subunit alpha [Blautia glucerasea]MCB6369501.1 L-serine ammonia-lyase, iron-sulfur-dependent, subunit alpha [Blautia glucerasea]
MDSALYANYLNILKHELVPALGCTEPIAIAYAAAKARQVLGEFPEQVEMHLSGNIIKNVKGVTVPNSGGLKGIDVAAVLGIVGGNADRALEVLSEVSPEDISRTRELISQKICSCSLVENVDNLFITAIVTSGKHSASVTIEHQHTNITKITKDGEIILDNPYRSTEAAAIDKSLLTVKDILDFADQVRMEDIQPVINRQIKLNSAIAQEGLDNNYGAQIGKTLMHVWGKSVTTRACARAAAGSDARMGGCSMPVVINSGSGNQGMTVSLPVIVFADEWEVSHEKLCRSLVVSNLIAIHQKYYIGSLSAYCGAVSAACGAGAGITYMYGGTYQQVSLTIINTLGNIGGIVCDGAKPSCAAKIATSVDAALMAFQLSIQNKSFLPGEGIIKDDIEETIKSMGYIGRVGMRATDTEILNVMIDQANIDQDC